MNFPPLSKQYSVPLAIILFFLICVGLLYAAQNKKVDLLEQQIANLSMNVQKQKNDVPAQPKQVAPTEDTLQQPIQHTNSESDGFASLMNYAYFENTDLSYEVKVALVGALGKYRKTDAPTASNDYRLSDVCQFEDANVSDTKIIKKIVSADIPNGYQVYVCDQDVHYGGGYYVRHQYTGGIPGMGTVGSIDAWYGPFAQSILLTQEDVCAPHSAFQSYEWFAALNDLYAKGEYMTDRIGVSDEGIGGCLVADQKYFVFIPEDFASASYCGDIWRYTIATGKLEAATGPQYCAAEFGDRDTTSISFEGKQPDTTYTSCIAHTGTYLFLENRVEVTKTNCE